MLSAIARRVKALFALPEQLFSRLDLLHLALGRIETRQTASLSPDLLQSSEFQVSSQWGEDGIIQFLIRHIPIARRVFVEFGVQDYREANTRFLLQNDNWSGLVMDGSQTNIAAIRRDPIYWRYNLKAHPAFVTRENINALITTQGIEGDIGLLSIDIDGNDYWVWEAVECVQPRIVVVEYNSLFGPEAKVTVPYDPGFERGRAHYSNLYWGASVAALAALGERKGYTLVGSNSAGNNAFFVRSEHLRSLPKRTPAEAHVEAQFRESRDESGHLTYLDRPQALKLIASMPVFDLDLRAIVTIKERLASGRGPGGA